MVHQKENSKLGMSYSKLASEEKDSHSTPTIFFYQINYKSIINVHQRYMGTCTNYIKVVIGFRKAITYIKYHVFSIIEIT
jgi:hypothetical protein